LIGIKGILAVSAIVVPDDHDRGNGMNFRCQVSHALDEEHRANLDLLGRVEQAFVRASLSGGARDGALATLAASFARHIEHDIGRHFDFEERELFPRLEAAGEGDIASLLEDEHSAIREVAAELLPLAHAAAAGTLDAAGWTALKRGALEMVERQVAHIQKETMALLPMLDDLLDEDTDRDLSFSYAAA
jgi:hemerythrin-like domain-containing protein